MSLTDESLTYESFTQSLTQSLSLRVSLMSLTYESLTHESLGRSTRLPLGISIMLSSFILLRAGQTVPGWHPSAAQLFLSAEPLRQPTVLLPLNAIIRRAPR